jgi:hypothetical protein
MKKLFVASCFMLGLAGITVAQQPKKKIAPAAAKLERVKPAVKEQAAPLKTDGILERRSSAGKAGKIAARNRTRDGATAPQSRQIKTIKKS